MNSEKKIDEVLNCTPPVSVFERLQRHAFAQSLVFFPFGENCCQMEFVKYFPSESIPAPEHSDVLLVMGPVTQKNIKLLKECYEKMPSPKWVIALGVCSTSGGPFRYFPVIQGLHWHIPIDVYIPGCPPTPEAISSGMNLLRNKIRKVAHERKG